jgi:hypothetical protein
MLRRHGPFRTPFSPDRSSRCLWLCEIPAASRSLHWAQARNLFRIISFADPYALTLIESHLYKNDGVAPPPRVPIPSPSFHSLSSNENLRCLEGARTSRLSPLLATLTEKHGSGDTSQTNIAVTRIRDFVITVQGSPQCARTLARATPSLSYVYFTIRCIPPVGYLGSPLVTHHLPLHQTFIQLHSFEYGTRLIRYPDFTPVTTWSLQLNPTPFFGSYSPGSSEKHIPFFSTVVSPSERYGG